jgi:NAD(P)H-flavin reductase
MLYLFGVGEVPISISGDPGQQDGITHTVRFVGNVTNAMSRLKPGDILGLRGPFGTHWPVETAFGNDLIFVAGGIGLAPLRPALYRVFAERRRYGKVTLMVGARTPGDILFTREFDIWRIQYDCDVLITVDLASPGWDGHVGVVTTLFKGFDVNPQHTTAYVCGPEIMMRFSLIELLKRGVPNRRLFVSLERNMKCGCGLCGHCQLGSQYICVDGPVYAYCDIRDWFGRGEL